LINIGIIGGLNLKRENKTMNIQEKIEKHLDERDRMYGDNIIDGEITITFEIDASLSDKYSIADKFAKKIERMKVKNIDRIEINSVNV